MGNSVVVGSIELGENLALHFETLWVEVFLPVVNYFLEWGGSEVETHTFFTQEFLDLFIS